MDRKTEFGRCSDGKCGNPLREAPYLYRAAPIIPGHEQAFSASATLKIVPVLSLGYDLQLFVFLCPND